MAFEASDGLRLAGWYAPSNNGAAVLLVHSAGGDRTGSVEHARMLSEHGYGVLLSTPAAPGTARGAPTGTAGPGTGCTGRVDLPAAPARRDPDRIGGLGLSTGADVLIEVAAQDRSLRAVVADGATGRSVADLPAGIPLEKPGLWTMFTTIRLLSGTAPGPPLGRLVADISPTPLLLVAAGSIPAERALNGGYAATAAEPVELWDLPDVTHTAAIRERADAYERRVISHFERALDPSRAHGPTALHRQR